MSALPPKADIAAAQTNVRFVPKADIPQQQQSIGVGWKMYCGIFVGRR